MFRSASLYPEEPAGMRPHHPLGQSTDVERHHRYFTQLRLVATSSSGGGRAAQITL
jgi:hypothetical protein